MPSHKDAIALCVVTRMARASRYPSTAIKGGVACVNETQAMVDEKCFPRRLLHSVLAQQLKSAMTTDEFVEQYNGAPYELEEFAQGAAKVEDNNRLLDAAECFLAAKAVFEEELETAGVQIG
jgi:hypothetical protein